MRRGSLFVLAMSWAFYASNVDAGVIVGSGGALTKTIQVDESLFRDIAKESIDGREIEIEGEIYEPREINLHKRAIEFRSKATQESLILHSSQLNASQE
jgi:hypothetical protein